MERTRIAPWAVVVPLAIAACTPQNDSKSGSNPNAAAAAPSGIVYEANVPAGGIEPPPGGVIKSPTLTADSAKSGENLFGSMNCDGCHGGGCVRVAATFAVALGRACRDRQRNNDGPWCNSSAFHMSFSRAYSPKIHTMPPWLVWRPMSLA